MQYVCCRLEWPASLEWQGMCNISEFVIMVPRTCLPFPQVSNNICAGCIPLAPHQRISFVVSFPAEVRNTF